MFLAKNVKVTGIDFSSKMIERAKKNAPEGVFHVMDIESLYFPLEKFEGAWANCSLLHLAKKNMPSVLDKIHAILKPKRYLYLSLKKGNDNEILVPDLRYQGLEKCWSFYEESELNGLLNSAGFEIIELAISGKSTDYQTHPIIKIFAKKI